MGSDWGWTGWRKATEGKGTDWRWVIEELEKEFGTPARLQSLKLEGILHRGNGEGDTSSLEEPGTLGGLRDCSWFDEDLGRRCRMEEKKEQDSGRGMVPIPLSNVRISQPEPAAQGEQSEWLRVVGKRTTGMKQQDKHEVCSMCSLIIIEVWESRKTDGLKLFQMDIKLSFMDNVPAVRKRVGVVCFCTHSLHSMLTFLNFKKES